MRLYYKCADCLSPVVLEGELPAGAGCTCGGSLEFMGEVVGPNKWQRKDTLCKCDRRCTFAQGNSCECSCGGVNHGAGMLAEVEVTETGRIEVRPADRRALQRAHEYRAELEAARGRMSQKWGEDLDRYQARIRLPEKTYWGIRRDFEDLGHAKGCRTHNGRLKALQNIHPELIKAPSVGTEGREDHEGQLLFV